MHTISRGNTDRLSARLRSTTRTHVTYTHKHKALPMFEWFPEGANAMAGTEVTAAPMNCSEAHEMPDSELVSPTQRRSTADGGASSNHTHSSAPTGAETSGTPHLSYCHLAKQRQRERARESAATYSALRHRQMQLVDLEFVDDLSDRLGKQCKVLNCARRSGGRRESDDATRT